MYCSVCLAPEGSWYPLTSPGKFLQGVERVPAVGAGPRGPRPRPQGPPAMASWAPCTAMASWAPSYAMASWAPCTAMASWAPSSAMASFVCLFRSGGSCPCLSWGASRAPTPPSPVELLRRGTRLPGGGSYVRVMLCASSVPASCVHIWFVSCPCFMSLWVKYVPAVFVSLSVINLCILVHACSVWCRLVYSLLPRCILSLSPALSCLDVLIKYYIWVTSSSACPCSSLVCAPWHTSGGATPQNVMIFE